MFHYLSKRVFAYCQIHDFFKILRSCDSSPVSIIFISPRKLFNLCNLVVVEHFMVILFVSIEDSDARVTSQHS